MSHADQLIEVATELALDAKEEVPNLNGYLRSWRAESANWKPVFLRERARLRG